MNLEMTERVRRTEYCDHFPLVRNVTGFDLLPGMSIDEQQKVWRKFYEWAGYDLLWNNTGLELYAYALDGSKFKIQRNFAILNTVNGA